MSKAKRIELVGNYYIVKTRETYKKTASGKSWASKPVTTESETVTIEQYNNFVNSIPFFNRFWLADMVTKSSCRGYRSYTVAGYIIDRVTTINPMRDTKTVDKFVFTLE